ncbi:uncharacterized membrane protein YkvA (DUF1232 family) [Kineococcus xinjiangensis]|uniref:Uncharacterized membrane protein YkvA (DUF1232 family) n=1 Tax=Kineococcus xinjiangensis TaxID=512762 RepID=A0A2S6IVL3_9ACTN|nr:YkvA family protein [Kineococcus xinjiangensis]PPK98402.1 uncharacterized membrane protein YkvA (DUF1232 family) [Kineococcus xinjiangensis]
MDAARTALLKRRGAALAVMWRTVRHGTPAGEPGVGQRLQALPRMVSAAARGEYRGTSRLRLLAAGAAAGYVLSPLDPLPEALLGMLGTVDDAVLAAWVAGTLLSATEDFLRWERAAPRTVPGQVVTHEVVVSEEPAPSATSASRRRRG